MHAHGIKGRKFGRETGERRALTRGLMCALIEHQSITTTLARAKEIRRDTEKLISIARKGGLSNRRLLVSRLNSIEVADLLMDEIAPQIKRDSGYLRIERAENRKGDNTEMATISFVDDITIVEEEPAEKADKKTAEKATSNAKKEAK